MSVLYRAVWTDKRLSGHGQAIEQMHRCVSDWAQDSPHSPALLDGETQLEVSQGRRRTVVHRTVGSEGFEVVTSDQVPGETTEWTTAIRVIADDLGVHTLVENSMESDDFTLRVSLGRPKIVHELLVQAEKPTLGGSVVLTSPLAIPAEGVDILADILADPRRTLPVIVCSEPGGDHDPSWLIRANRIAARSEGVAAVITIDNDAVTALKDRLGALSIWGGGIRVYVPVPVDATSDGWRHRYYSRSRLDEAPQATIDRIVYSVSQLSARRRVPEVFRRFADQTDLPISDQVEMISASDFESARVQWEFDLDLALEERSELEKEIARANGHLARLKEELIARGLSDVLWGTEHDTAASIPDEVQDTSEAVLAAQTYLSEWLSVPDSAARDLADIDTAPTAFAWGNNAWRGLRALAAYAEDRAHGWNNGGFWEWCASGPLLGWPATSKKLSMSESETVQNNDKLRRARTFKVDRALDDSGETSMMAHLKISEGGGNLAPRIYFYDDTGGPTKKIHVGFVGPHYLVPNKSTN